MYKVGEQYTSNDIYEILSVPLEKRCDDWLNGYHRHHSNYYILSNVGLPGATGPDPNIHWDGEKLVWHGKVGSLFDQDSIRNLISGKYKVLIFCRFQDRDPFTFAGVGKVFPSLSIEKPIRIEWILNQKNIEKESEKYRRKAYSEQNDVNTGEFKNAPDSFSKREICVFSGADQNHEDVRVKLSGDWHDIVASFQLSVRATNVLQQNFNSFDEFLNASDNDLFNLKNCGRKTVLELLEFKTANNFQTPKKQELSLSERLSSPPDETTLAILPLFSSKKINDFVRDDLHRAFLATTLLSDLVLSVRTSNVLSELRMQTIGEVMLTPGSSLLEQQNFGRKSLTELQDIVRSLCLTGLPVSGELAEEMDPVDYSSFKNMIVSFVGQCEKNKRNQSLLIKRLYFKEGKAPTLEELGLHFGITRERARQILKKVIKKLQIKTNLDKLHIFSERLNDLVVQGGGLIDLGELSINLQVEYNWHSAPYSLALGQLLLLWCPDESFKNETDLYTVNSECLSCDDPLQQLLALDFEGTESYHVKVVAKKLSDHCQESCSWQPVTTFHRAFIEHLVNDSEGRLVLYGDVVLPMGTWLRKYCDKLERVVCQVLESNGEPMHFRKIGETIRRENIHFGDLSDHNVHAAIMRYETIEIINRGTYGLKSWGLGGYRSVSTAIEEIIDEKGLPQRRHDIIHELKGEFSEGNITASLQTETRFVSIGDGFYDRPQNWQQRSCQELIKLLPESVAEFARYLVGRNNTSYKLVMAFIFVRSMDEQKSLYLFKLKEMFLNFYLSRRKKGLVVEVDGAVMSRVGELPAGEVKSRACKEPLKSIFTSGFLVQFSQNGGKLHLADSLASELDSPEVRDLLLVTILKAIDDYFRRISPAISSYDKQAEPPQQQQVAEPAHTLQEESPRSTDQTDQEKNTPTISIKKKGRGKIRL